MFESIYISLYELYKHLLPDSRIPVKNLYAYDSTTITLFCDVLKGCDKAYERGGKAATIAKIYRKRWQIELMFKKLKQNFQLKYFYGDSANAIEIQVWCVLIACLLMSVFRAANKIQKMSFSNMMFVVRRVLMEYVWLCAVMTESERTLARMLSRQNQAHAPPTLFD